MGKLRRVTEQFVVVHHPDLALSLWACQEEALASFQVKFSADLVWHSSIHKLRATIYNDFALALMPAFSSPDSLGTSVDLIHPANGQPVSPSTESIEVHPALDFTSACLDPTTEVVGVDFGNPGCYPLTLPVYVATSQVFGNEDIGVQVSYPIIEAAGLRLTPIARKVVAFWMWMMFSTPSEESMHLTAVTASAVATDEQRRWMFDTFRSITFANGTSIYVAPDSSPSVSSIALAAVAGFLVLAIVVLAALYVHKKKQLARMSSIKADPTLDLESPVFKVIQYLEASQNLERMKATCISQLVGAD
eukprot:scaffold74439_cov33-Prasinocladus_malaysianus.AAC.3